MRSALTRWRETFEESAMALTRGTGSRNAVQTVTIAGEVVDLPAVLFTDASGNSADGRDTAFRYAGATGGIIDTADVVIAPAAGAGIRNYLTSLQFKNTSAVASEIVVKDGATVIWRGHVSATMAFEELVTFGTPLRGTANTALNVAMITTATATIVSAQGFTGA
jgi:hypothetical protein